MRQTSINKAKKEIWLRLQAYTTDESMWESEIEDNNWSWVAFDKALTSVFNQIERKL